MRAVPVAPWAMPVVQSDGTTLMVKAVGDEWWHCLMTTDGLAVAHGEYGDLYYRMGDVVTTVRAHNPEARQADEVAFVRAHSQELAPASVAEADAGKHRARRRADVARLPQVQPMGRPRVPVIMVQYPDKKM